jgi:hypothetical protein
MENKHKIIQDLKDIALLLSEHYALNIKITCNVNSNLKNVKIDIKECNL